MSQVMTRTLNFDESWPHSLDCFCMQNSEIEEYLNGRMADESIKSTQSALGTKQSFLSQYREPLSSFSVSYSNSLLLKSQIVTFVKTAGKKSMYKVFAIYVKFGGKLYL